MTVSDSSKPQRAAVLSPSEQLARMAQHGLKPPPSWPEPGPPPVLLPPEGVRRWRLITEGSVSKDVDLDQPPEVRVHRDIVGGTVIECADELPLKAAARFLAGALRDSPRRDLVEQRQAALVAILDRLDQIEVLRAQAAARGGK